MDERNQNLEGSILIASDKYLYRGFGKYKNSQYNQSIMRFKINPIGKEWELLSEKSTPIRSDGREDTEIKL